MPLPSTVARPMFAAWSMDFEAIAEVLMPIRIKRHDKGGRKGTSLIIRRKSVMSPFLTFSYNPYREILSCSQSNNSEAIICQ